MKLDVIDCRILNTLQQQGRLSNQELAEQVALSPSACFRRVKLLEEAGVIERYQAVLDFKKAGIGLEAVIHASIDQSQNDWHSYFAAEISKMNEVLHAYVVTGDCNYILIVRAKSLDDFSSFIIHKLNKIKGVRDLHTYIVLERLVSRNTMLLEPV